MNKKFFTETNKVVSAITESRLQSGELEIEVDIAFGKKSATMWYDGHYAFDVTDLLKKEIEAVNQEGKIDPEAEDDDEDYTEGGVITIDFKYDEGMAPGFEDPGYGPEVVKTGKLELQTDRGKYNLDSLYDMKQKRIISGGAKTLGEFIDEEYEKFFDDL